MAGLVPAIHVFLAGDKDVDARDKRGHDPFAVVGILFNARPCATAATG
jgi:hypothetical protein